MRDLNQYLTNERFVWKKGMKVVSRRHYAGYHAGDLRDEWDGAWDDRWISWDGAFGCALPDLKRCSLKCDAEPYDRIEPPYSVGDANNNSSRIALAFTKYLWDEESPEYDEITGGDAARHVVGVDGFGSLGALNLYVPVLLAPKYRFERSDYPLRGALEVSRRTRTPLIFDFHPSKEEAIGLWRMNSKCGGSMCLRCIFAYNARNWDRFLDEYKDEIRGGERDIRIYVPHYIEYA